MARKSNYDIMPGVHSVTDGYRALAAAICTQAVRDYMQKSPSEKGPAERFILSGNFTILSGGLDGEEVLKILNRQIRNGRNRSCVG